MSDNSQGGVILEDMLTMSESVGSPYMGWRITESAKQQGVDKQLAYEAISPVQQHLGHAVRAIYGEQFADAKKILLQAREQIDKSLTALGEGTPLNGGR